MTASKSGSDPARALRRVRVAGLAAGLIAALFVAIVGGALRRDLFDLWQRLAPRDLRDTQVVVVAIDNESLARFGGWPWSRYHVARLTEGIAARRPLAIGYDIIFAEKDPLAPGVVAGLFPELDPASAQRIRQLRSNDDLLGQAMGRAQVVLARAGTDAGGREPAELTVEAELSGPFPSRTPAYPRAEASIPELEFSARGFGLIASSPDADGVFRKVPLVGKVGTQPFPGLSLELVRVARRLDAIRFGARAAELGDTRIPIDDRGQMFLRFGDFPDASTISAADLVPLPDQPGQSVPSDALRDKIVLIGLTAEGTEDVVPTPLVREMSGVYMHALATDAIMRGGGWLERPRWALPAEWVGGLLLVLLVVYALPRRGPLQLIVPALPLLLFGLSFLAFSQAALLLDPLSPMLLAAAAAAGVGLASFRETRGERERLRDALVIERIAAARTEEEMRQARGIQLGMLPPAGSLARLDPRLEIGAALEPARSVGGDFYDAVRLDADRIAFCIADVTGKGVPAALFMALSKALARSIILRETRLDVATSLLNEELSRDGIDSGLTLILGIIDLSTGEVALVSAGHDDPFRIAADGVVTDVKLEGGPPLCILDFPWPIERVRLAPGEALVLITDGVSEAQTGEGAFYGRERAVEALTAAAMRSAEEFTAALVRSVREFEAGAEPSDDLTVIALRYRG